MSRIVVVLSGLLLGTVAACAEEADFQLTEEQAEALALLKGVMTTDWGPFLAPAKRKPGESVRESHGRFTKVLLAATEKDRQVAEAIKKLIPAESEEIKPVLEHFTRGWLDPDGFWCNVTRIRPSGEISTDVAKEVLFKRRLAKVPQDERLDTLTVWALEERYPFSRRYLSTNFTGREALEALVRWAARSDLPRRFEQDPMFAETIFFYFQATVAPARKNPLPWHEVEQAAVSSPPAIRWIVLRILASKGKPVGALAKRLLKEHGELPFVESKAIGMLEDYPETRLWALDYVSRKIAEGEFFETSMGTYAALGGSCKKHRQGRELLEFTLEHAKQAKDENLIRWIEKELAEVREQLKTGAERSRQDETGVLKTDEAAEEPGAGGPPEAAAEEETPGEAPEGAAPPAERPGTGDAVWAALGIGAACLLLLAALATRRLLRHS